MFHACASYINWQLCTTWVPHGVIFLLLYQHTAVCSEPLHWRVHLVVYTLYSLTPGVSIYTSNARTYYENTSIVNKQKHALHAAVCAVCKNRIDILPSTTAAEIRQPVCKYTVIAARAIAFLPPSSLTIIINCHLLLYSANVCNYYWEVFRPLLAHIMWWYTTICLTIHAGVFMNKVPLIVQSDSVYYRVPYGVYVKLTCSYTLDLYMAIHRIVQLGARCSVYKGTIIMCIDNAIFACAKVDEERRSSL